jgi:hypothetical protein
LNRQSLPWSPLEKLADEPVSRILCNAPSHEGRHIAAIIPLVLVSPPGSSSLPEGCSQRLIAPSSRENTHLREHSRRAGPALPSYLALHHAGFSVPPMLPPERWALTPPFHPCQTERAFRRRLAGFPARCHRASLSRRYILCGTFRSAAVAPGFSPASSTSPPGVTRRVALFRHRLSRAYDDGVRTFLPLCPRSAGL